MSSIEKFKNPSRVHKVEPQGAGFSIVPIDDSESALANFQPIAREALNGSYAGYETVRYPLSGEINDVFFGEKS